MEGKMSDELVEKLRAALDELVHANEDEIDDYPRIHLACVAAKKLLPDYTDRVDPE